MTIPTYPNSDSTYYKTKKPKATAFVDKEIEALKAQNAKLKTDYDEAVGMLKKYQYTPGYGCPECKNHRDEGHAEDCALNAIIQKHQESKDD